jgi:hypothetical protein
MSKKNLQNFKNRMCKRIRQMVLKRLARENSAFSIIYIHKEQIDSPENDVIGEFEQTIIIKQVKNKYVHNNEINPLFI